MNRLREEKLKNIQNKGKSMEKPSTIKTADTEIQS
jgi:hypothetical protein